MAKKDKEIEDIEIKNKHQNEIIENLNKDKNKMELVKKILFYFKIFI